MMTRSRPLVMLSILACGGVLVSCQRPTAMKEGVKSPASFDVAAFDRARVLKAAGPLVGDLPDTVTSHPVPVELRSPAWTVHDFYSEADYDWPNPANPKGPYVYRDGESNPNAFLDHRHAMWRMERDVATLTAAYVVTGDRKYAEPAIGHLRAWFVNPETRMNPSLPYAQAVRNKNFGEVYGLIDTLHLVEVARSIVVLRQHHLLSADDDAAMTKWFGDYIQWLRTSDHGVKEGNAHNNHATAYWVQIGAFAQVAGDEGALAECRKRYKTELLTKMAADGSFPAELARTKPYGYSLFNLDQMMALCEIASVPGDDLFAFTLPDGRNIHRGLEYMYPFVADKSAWKRKPDVMVFDQLPVRSPAWLWGAERFDEPKYLALWKRLEGSPANEEVLRNNEMRQPVLWK